MYVHGLGYSVYNLFVNTHKSKSCDTNNIPDLTVCLAYNSHGKGEGDSVFHVIDIQAASI